MASCRTLLTVYRHLMLWGWIHGHGATPLSRDRYKSRYLLPTWNSEALGPFLETVAKHPKDPLSFFLVTADDSYRQFSFRASHWKNLIVIIRIHRIPNAFAGWSLHYSLMVKIDRNYPVSIGRTKLSCNASLFDYLRANITFVFDNRLDPSAKTCSKRTFLWYPYSVS